MHTTLERKQSFLVATRRPKVGLSDFKETIEENRLYVDKSLLIQELLDNRTPVVFISRPRLFGKTLNLSMLRYFFEKTEDNTSRLFTSLKIWESEKYRAYQGQFPVIYFSLNGTRQSSPENTYRSLAGLVSDEFRRHKYLFKEVASLPEEKFFRQILDETADQELIEKSLFYLIQCLHKFHKKKVIVLIDQYDTPIRAAHEYNHAEKTLKFLSNWLSIGLKDNHSLERAVLTGIQPLHQKSIFPEWNDLLSCTMTDLHFGDKFGFTEAEVKQLLHESNLSSVLPDACKMYNGYQIGSHTGIYNPWSIANLIRKQGSLDPFWLESTDNLLVKELLPQSSAEVKIGLEDLLQRIPIEKTIDNDPQNIWALLLCGGYLTIDQFPTHGTSCKVRIPNDEIFLLYKSIVRSWLPQCIGNHYYDHMLKSLTTGDTQTFSEFFIHFLKSFSTVFDIPLDQPEKLYHAFVLGMLVSLSDRYEVKSNRESGLGRYDVMLIPKDPQQLGIVMEFKKIDLSEKGNLSAAAKSAIKQIEDKKYAHELRVHGVKQVLLLGLAFKGKEVLIRSKTKTFRS